MAGIKQRRKTWVSTSGDSDYYPSDIDEPKRYCVRCENMGFPYQELGERIYFDDQLINGQIPHDSELWRQCYKCGTIVAISDAKQESHIKGFIDLPELIHDTRRVSVEHFIKPRKLRERLKKIQPRQQESTVLVPPEDDKDIQALTESTSGKELQSYSDSTS